MLSLDNAKLLNLFYAGGFGMALFINPDTFFGPSGFAPYFGHAATELTQWNGRAFGAQLIGMASFFFLSNDENSSKMGLKMCTVAHVMMLPLMLKGAFDETSGAYLNTMWKVQVAMHLPVLYATYAAGFGSSDKKKK